MPMVADKNTLMQVGWREWVSLPSLGIDHIKAKVDSGARTSALHTFQLEKFKDGQVDMVRFALHPDQYDGTVIRLCEVPIKDERWVKDSGGHREFRPVIETMLSIGGCSWPIELTLTSRENMRFRMLLGRTAIKGKIVIDPGRSYLTGERTEYIRETS